MSPTGSFPPLGLQPIVLGQQYSLPDPRVLDHIKSCGYEALECGSDEPIAFRAALDQRGLRQGGAHTSPSGLLDVQPVLKNLRILGGQDVCNSGLYNWHERTEESYRLTAAILNRAGKLLRAEGVHLHYHNHDFEFTEEVNGQMAIDYLLDLFDPEAVDLCVDVGWVAKAGQDPVEFLRKHADRIGYIHLKDFDDEGWTELGRGKVDWGSVIPEVRGLPGVRWAMVEQDTSRNDPLDSIRWSREFLRNEFSL